MAESAAKVNQEEAWEVVVSESGVKVVFDTFGDVFQGVKVRTITITPEDDEPFIQHLFYGHADFPADTLYAINESYKLTAIGEIPSGKLTRITYIKDIPVGKGNDLKDFRVETRNLPIAERVKYPNVDF